MREIEDYIVNCTETVVEIADLNFVWLGCFVLLGRVSKHTDHLVFVLLLDIGIQTFVEELDGKFLRWKQRLVPFYLEHCEIVICM